ncbi:hypothetical protein C8Q79DRAFT_673672 [Trametes meyenii]|nr:hypothetical protein C8Q79DRAFT_673672 [Trametes meyenii]
MEAYSRLSAVYRFYRSTHADRSCGAKLRLCSIAGAERSKNDSSSLVVNSTDARYGQILPMQRRSERTLAGPVLATSFCGCDLHTIHHPIFHSLGNCHCKTADALSSAMAILWLHPHIPPFPVALSSLERSCRTQQCVAIRSRTSPLSPRQSAHSFTHAVAPITFTLISPISQSIWKPSSAILCISLPKTSRDSLMLPPCARTAEC